MNIQEIQLKSFPLVIITDTHTNLRNIDLVRAQYPNNQIISLGDLTFLFSKPGEKYNHRSIDYFIKHKIPCLQGNHENFIIASERGNSFVLDRVMGQTYDYDLTIQQLNYLEKLPVGFKIILSDGSNYLAFHNRPNDLWNFTEEAFTRDSFLKTYPIDNNTRAVCIGHNHRNFIVDYPEISAKLIGIGHLCGSDHHSKKNNGGNYALLTENGIEFKKI